jgi:hypothetical protein
LSLRLNLCGAQIVEKFVKFAFARSEGHLAARSKRAREEVDDGHEEAMTSSDASQISSTILKFGAQGLRCFKALQSQSSTRVRSLISANLLGSMDKCNTA